MLETVTIEKLVHGGQGLGTLADGRKVLVWNALPTEQVGARLTKSKKSYAEGIAEEIIKPAKERIEAQEANFLSTSPWQILDFAAENHWKKEITKELFTQAGVQLPDFDITHGTETFHYRNKMEYSFWGDDNGLHLALHNRGTHQKQIVTGSALAMSAIDVAAQAVVDCLPKNTRAGDLKSLIVRCSQGGKTAAALFVKRQDFYELKLPKGIDGLRVYYSNPKSPASVRTKLLYELGDCTLTDDVQNVPLTYDVDSFFQVNVPVFEQSMASMKQFITEDTLTDMYAGVGSIGLTLAKKSVQLIELDSSTAAMGKINAAASSLLAEVIETSAENALDYITADTPIIFDPPRAGLHEMVCDRILEVLPPKLIYLSCNPATQARDLAKLQEKYKIKHFEVFNFFPRTPHIESLAVLQLSK